MDWNVQSGGIKPSGAEAIPRPGINPKGRSPEMIGILIAVLVAALVWAVCVALGLPAIVGIVAAILVLLAGIPSGGYGLGSRFGGAGRRY
jgi:hypothetical protein